MSEEVPLKRFILIAVLILSAGLIGGYLSSVYDPQTGESLLLLFQEMIANDIMQDDPPQLAVQLFLNNLQACVMLFLGGATFGLITIFVLLFNGLIIGAVLQVVGDRAGSLMVFAAIIPHGIFELPAVIVSGALGLLLGFSLRSELFGAGDAGKDALLYGKLFLRYVVPFIAIAACVEAFITPAILQLVA